MFREPVLNVRVRDMAAFYAYSGCYAEPTGNPTRHTKSEPRPAGLASERTHIMT